MSRLSTALTASLIGAAALHAQTGKCVEQYGIRSAGGPNGYDWRSDRCEGVFAQDVAASDLRLVSFAGLTSALDIKALPELKLSWTPAGNADVQFRAVSLRSRHYYRMDTVRPASVKAYAWPTNVIRTENLAPQELGLAAWTRVPALNQDVYLPLRVGESPPSGVLLQSDADIEEIYVSWAKLGADNKPSVFLQKNQPLNRGPYPARRAFKLDLPKALAAGYYRLDAAAHFRDGRDTTKTFYVFMP